MKKLLILLWAVQAVCSEKRIDYYDFAGLMGKGTSHWEHVHQEEDLSLLSQIESLYQKNKDAQFSSSKEYKIPPLIHLIWLGPKPFPPESVENLRSWIAYHPEWKIKLWTDRDREAPCEGIEMVDAATCHFSRLGECYRESLNWAEKSDLLRYEILLAEGGVYVDHDAYCIGSFEGLVRGYDFFCCLEPPHEPFVGLNVTCWNGLIGARAGHPMLARTIDLIAARWDSVGRQFRGRDLYSQVEVVMQRTYIAFTHALDGTLDHPGNMDIVFPAAYFFAKSSMPSIYSKHFCQTTWDAFKSRKPELEKFGEKSLRKIRHQSKKGIYIVSAILFLSALFLIFSFRTARVFHE